MTKTYSWPNSLFSVSENLSDLVKELQDAPGRVEPVVKKYAFAIQADAAGNAPVDTGALKNSMTAEPISGPNWIVSDSVEYGVFQELGTSRNPALHFLGGAAEKFADPFFDEVKKALVR